MSGLTEIAGVGPSVAAALVKSNYRTIAKIAAASEGQLSAVPGISAKGAGRIIASAKALLAKPPLPKATVINKRRTVAPIKIEKKTVAVQAPEKPLKKEKKMSPKDVKDKIRKLKKKIKKLKVEKKKIIAKESKKSKKKPGKQKK